MTSPLTGVWSRHQCRLQGASVLPEGLGLSQLEAERGRVLGNLQQVRPASANSQEHAGKRSPRRTLGLGVLDRRHTSAQCLVSDQESAADRAKSHLQAHPQVIYFPFLLWHVFVRPLSSNNTPLKRSIEMADLSTMLLEIDDVGFCSNLIS